MTWAARRTFAGRVAALAALAVGAGSAWGCVTEAGPSLTVVSWGGSYARACVLGYHERFTAETGIEIRLESYNGGLALVRAQVETGNVHWDLIDVEIADAVSGCDEGILEPIDPAMLPPGPDGTPATDDFFPGALTECGVGTSFFATVYAYHPARFPDGPPTTIEDFFDPRALPRPPRHAARPAREPGVRADRGRRAGRRGLRRARHPGGRCARLPQAGTPSRTRSSGGRPAHNRRRCSPTARWS